MHFYCPLVKLASAKFRGPGKRRPVALASAGPVALASPGLQPVALGMIGPWPVRPVAQADRTRSPGKRRPVAQGRKRKGASTTGPFVTTA